MTSRRFLTALLTALILGASVATTAATREQAIARALAADGNRGRVLEVRREEGANGGAVFLVKTITDGRVRVHRIPADG